MRLPRRSLGLDRFSGIYLWALFVLVFGLWEPGTFLTKATLDSISSEQAVGAMLGIVVVLPLAAGVYDLSIGATANLSAIAATWLQDSHHWAVWPATAAAVGCGVVIGATNGFLVVKLKVNAFIATLGMATVVAAVQEIISVSQPLPPTSQAWAHLSGLEIGGIQIVVVYMLVLAAILWWVLEHTPAGRYLRAIGANAESARLAGVNVGGWQWLAFVVAAAVAGIAGVLYASQNGPSTTFGTALLLPAYAAAFLGSTQLRPGRFNIWGTVLAVYVLATGVDGLELATGVAWLNDMFNGVALIVAVAFAVWRQGKTGRVESAPSADSNSDSDVRDRLRQRSVRTMLTLSRRYMYSGQQRKPTTE
ncbi:MAG TPA: ABC transporter permease [Streptosporangiaceae bacterium]|nr:ABC transporter permease [Streptosporangiaceae bacterium]